MASYLAELRQAWTSRRGFLKLAAGSAGAAALGPRSAARRSRDQARAARTLSSWPRTRRQSPSGSKATCAVSSRPSPTTSPPIPVVCNISEGLMMFTPGGWARTAVAESFEQPDELTYVYTLRDGVVFSDGSPVTIDDVVASIARVRDPEVAGPLAWMYDVPEATVETTDDKTITITLATPSALFRYVPRRPPGTSSPRPRSSSSASTCCATRSAPVPTSSCELGRGQRDRAGEEPQLLAGRQAPLRPLHLSRSSRRARRASPGSRTGELSMITVGATGPARSGHGLRERRTSRRSSATRSTMIALRTDRPPFDDVNIRKAVCYATPLEAIMENIVGVTGVQSRNTTVPPNMPGSASDELEPIPYDLERAKELMAASSMPDGFSTTAQRHRAERHLGAAGGRHPGGAARDQHRRRDRADTRTPT